MPEWLLHLKVDDPHVYRKGPRAKALCSNVTRRYHLTGDHDKVNCSRCLEMMADQVAHKLGRTRGFTWHP